jgi:signal transduction histidine kinase
MTHERGLAVESSHLNLLRRPWVRWGLYFGIWTVFAVADACQSYALSSLLGQRPPLTLPECLALTLSMCYCLALLALPLLWLARRLSFSRHAWQSGDAFDPIADRRPPEPQRWRGPLIILLMATIVAALLKVILEVPAERLIRPANHELQKRTDLQLLQIFFSAYFLFYLLVFWLVLGIAYALDFYRRYRERELHAAHLEGQLAVAQLQVLKMQLQPHFLFNTLHAISALIHQNVEVADRMVARLGELLRTTLDSAGIQEVSLRQELAFIEPYLEIEQARLGPRLTIRIEAEASILDARLPNLLLQPLVENAVRHGVAAHAGPGVIEIRACRERDLLKLTIRDNGRGLSSNYVEGVGVSNTRARLRQLYGAAQRFEMHNHPEGGLLVTVALPYREEAEDSPLYPVSEKRGREPSAKRLSNISSSCRARFPTPLLRNRDHRSRRSTWQGEPCRCAS